MKKMEKRREEKIKRESEKGMEIEIIKKGREDEEDKW